MQLLGRSDDLAPQLAGFAVAANQQFPDSAFSVVGRCDPVLVNEKLGGADDVWVVRQDVARPRVFNLGGLESIPWLMPKTLLTFRSPHF
jgi:hypothetical protein